MSNLKCFLRTAARAVAKASYVSLLVACALLCIHAPVALADDSAFNDTTPISNDEANSFNAKAPYFSFNEWQQCANGSGSGPANANKPVIVIDPGHSGTDNNVVDPETGLDDHDYPNYPEINDVFDVAQLVQQQLTTDGYKVLMTKNAASDTVTFRQRATIANNANAALAISIHDQGGSGGFTFNQFSQVYPQKVGEYRQNANAKVTFNNASVAAASQQYAQIFQQTRSQAEGSNTVVKDNSFDGRAGIDPGNLSMVQLFSNVPWVYNEVGGNSAGQSGLSSADKQKYASGLIAGVEKSIPLKAATGVSSGSSSSSSSARSGSFTIDQVKTFASEAITSAWNISDSTAEQWFLKQAGAQATKSKYGLNSSNIGQITAAVRAANVSPVFFYLYTVNEGGGAGGFINHYGSDTTGGGPGNATRDAQYLASESKTRQNGVATGGGEPSDMPTAEAQQILTALPLGSIGVVYVQSTSAVTAELEDLSGKTGDWTGLFGTPLQDMMHNIRSMGGDPQQGGSTVSTSGCAGGGVTGQGILKAVSWAVTIANNNGYGYDQPTRASGWAKWQSDPSCTNQCGSFDCSSFIAAALTEAGYFPTNPEFNTNNEAAALTGAGFNKIADSTKTSQGLKSGDILLWAGHTEMYIGNDQAVAAHINENGGVSGGQVGDQTGNEISVESFQSSLSSDVWIGIYRASH